MAKRKKSVKRRSKVNGLGAMPKEVVRGAVKESSQYLKDKAQTQKELKAIVPGDARQYDAGKKAFASEIANDHCRLALTYLANSAFSAGVARAAAVARGEPGGAESLYADFMTQRNEYLAVCHPEQKKK